MYTRRGRVGVFLDGMAGLPQVLFRAHICRRSFCPRIKDGREKFVFKIAAAPSAPRVSSSPSFAALGISSRSGSRQE